MPTKRGDMWEGRLKLGGRVVKTRRFDTKRAAAQWERRQRAAFDEHGYDPRLGKVPVEDLIRAWLEQREGKVTKTTLDTDFAQTTLHPGSGQGTRSRSLSTSQLSMRVSRSRPSL